jgi:hypothetical protein
LSDRDIWFFVLRIGSVGRVTFWKAECLDFVGGRENPLSIEDTDRVERALGGEERSGPAAARQSAFCS